MTRIAIDPGRPAGRLDRKVFGGFVEHPGRCVYGGLYEEGSPLSDDRGFRKDAPNVSANSRRVETAQLESGSEETRDGVVAVVVPVKNASLSRAVP